MHTVMLYLTSMTIKWYIPFFRPLRPLTIRKDVHGSNIGLTEKTAAELPDEMVHSYRQGSIYAFVAWISYIFMVWSFKGVLMFLYNRITLVILVWEKGLLVIIADGITEPVSGSIDWRSSWVFSVFAHSCPRSFSTLASAILLKRTGRSSHMQEVTNTCSSAVSMSIHWHIADNCTIRPLNYIIIEVLNIV